MKVNADIEAESAEAPRRGYSEPPLGAEPAEAETRDLGFQNFQVSLRVYSPQGWHGTQLMQ